MEIGVFGGSFNPVHIGHLIVADYIRQVAGLDKVLMMLSPQNPLKTGNSELIGDSHRLAMLRTACAGVPGLEPCDLELSLPRPSYTVNTLAALSRNRPADRLSLIIGGDNWRVFNRWKDYQNILRNYRLIIYPRDGFPASEDCNASSSPMVVAAPQIEISSTFIRNSIARGLDVNLMLPQGVYQYIKDNNLYGI